MNTAAIVNPAARRGRAGVLWARLAADVPARQVVFTERAGHASELARRLVLEGFTRLVVGGGDGTLNEVANGVRESGAAASLALLPLGSGADMARCLGIPLHLKRAVEVLRSGVERTIDLAVLRCRDASGAATERCFVNVASIGLGGRVALHRAANASGYLRAAVTALLTMRPPRIGLGVDDEPARDIKAYHVALGNGRFTGAGMHICPEASPDDGLLDITVIEARPVLRLVSGLHLLYSGRIYSHPAIRRYRARSVRADSAETVSVEADGEPAGFLPLEARVLPRALRVVVPRVE